MKLTALECKLLCAGNPPELVESLPRQYLHEYSQDEQDAFIEEYLHRRWGYRRLAEYRNWNPGAAYTLLSNRNVLRSRQAIPMENYAILKKHLAANMTSKEIAEQTGWKLRYVRNLRENLRKREYHGAPWKDH